MYAILSFMGVLMVSIGLGTVVIGGIGFFRDMDDSTAHRTLMVGLGLFRRWGCAAFAFGHQDHEVTARVYPIKGASRRAPLCWRLYMPDRYVNGNPC